MAAYGSVRKVCKNAKTRREVDGNKKKQGVRARGVLRQGRAGRSRKCKKGGTGRQKKQRTS